MHKGLSMNDTANSMIQGEDKEVLVLLYEKFVEEEKWAHQTSELKSHQLLQSQQEVLQRRFLPGKAGCLPGHRRAGPSDVAADGAPEAGWIRETEGQKPSRAVPVGLQCGEANDEQSEGDFVQMRTNKRLHFEELPETPKRGEGQ